MSAGSVHGSRCRQLFKLAAPAVVPVLLLLGACKGPDGTSGAAGDPGPAETAAIQAAAATPVGIQIPAIGVDARVVPVGLEANGHMEVPDFGLAGWYEPGPRPGEPGPAVIVAHVDSRSGPDVFARLADLEPGDRIVVQGGDGTALAFTAEWSEQTPKDELPVERIWADSDLPLLRLITCGGSFDASTGHYRDNVIVYARPA